ncbi:hypothetical protein Bhyg_12022, partial [Pseudolycoriella hygida]
LHFSFDKAVSSIGCGLLNFGNICYLNATFQTLFHIPKIVDCFQSEADKMMENNCAYEVCHTGINNLDYFWKAIGVHFLRCIQKRKSLLLLSSCTGSKATKKRVFFFFLLKQPTQRLSATWNFRVIKLTPSSSTPVDFAKRSAKTLCAKLNTAIEVSQTKNGRKDLVMFEIDPALENNLLYPESENGDSVSPQSVSEVTALYRSASLHSNINRIVDNLDFLEVVSNPGKRNRPNDSSEQEVGPVKSNPIKKARVAMSTPKPKQLPLTSDIAKKDFHIVDIVSDDDSIAHLTENQGEKISTAVLKEILQAENIHEIKFEDSYNDRGKYRYICSSATTREWLIAIIPKITPWGNAKIKPVYQGPPPTLIKHTITVSMPSLDPGDILSLISAQNPTIDTSKWKCVHRSKAMNGKQVWTIGVEDSSIEALKDADYRPYVGAHRIKFNPANWFINLETQFIQQMELLNMTRSVKRASKFL